MAERVLYHHIWRTFGLLRAAKCVKDVDLLKYAYCQHLRHGFQIKPGHATHQKKKRRRKETSHVNDLRLQTAERFCRFISEEVEVLINTYCHINGCVILESIRCY